MLLYYLPLISFTLISAGGDEVDAGTATRFEGFDVVIMATQLTSAGAPDVSSLDHWGRTDKKSRLQREDKASSSLLSTSHLLVGQVLVPFLSCVCLSACLSVSVCLTAALI